MTLFELTSNLFLFLVIFRRKVRKGIFVDLSEVASQLEMIFAEQQAEARSDPRLDALYEKAKYALVALADEVILTCDWEHAAEWEAQTLEERYFGTRIAGDEFFALIDQLREDEEELSQIYYSCLCLGFTGRYREDAPELRTLRSRLYRQIPAYMASREEKLCPNAYHVSEGARGALTPLINLARVAIVCLVFLVVFYIATWATWDTVTKDVEKVRDNIEESAEGTPDGETGS